jgi:hypothetical protein
MIFLYKRHPAVPTPTSGNVLYRPEIPIWLHGVTGNMLLVALIDCGSDDTLLPLSAAHVVGAKIDPSQKWHVEGLAAGVEAILGEVEFELATPAERFRWPAQVGLVDFPNPEDEFAVLGHAGFLDYFVATLDGDIHAVELTPARSFPGIVS